MEFSPQDALQLIGEQQVEIRVLRREREQLRAALKIADAEVKRLRAQAEPTDAAVNGLPNRVFPESANHAE